MSGHYKASISERRENPAWLSGLPGVYDERASDGQRGLRVDSELSALVGNCEVSAARKVAKYTDRITVLNQAKAEIKAFFLDTKLNLLLAAFPFAIISKAARWGDAATFTFSMIALCPLAERLGFVTEQLAMYTNDTLGGLLNATFGNATEVIISGFALRAGLMRVVQLSLLGSVVSNLLLVLGSAFLAGGMRHSTQKFNQQGNSVNSALLILGTVAVLLPSLLSETATEAKENVSELFLSRFESMFMLILYGCYLLFQLFTHRFLYEEKEDTKDSGKGFGSDHPLTRGDEAEWRLTTSHGIADEVVDASGTAGAGTRGGGGGGSAMMLMPPSTTAAVEMTMPSLVQKLSTTGRHMELTVRTATTSRSNSGRPDANTSTAAGRASATGTTAADSPSAVTLRNGLANIEAGRDEPTPSKDVGDGGGGDDDDELVLSKVGCFLWLTTVTLCISLLSEWIVDAITGASRALHMPMPFLTTILLPIVGNAAEHASAIVFAYKGRIEIALGVAVGSATQVAVLIIPFCVVLAWCMGQPLDLNFNAFEAGVYFCAVLLTIITLQDGTANWLKGALLLVTYMLVASGFWMHKDHALQVEDVDN